MISDGRRVKEGFCEQCTRTKLDLATNLEGEKSGGRDSAREEHWYSNPLRWQLCSERA